MKGDQHSNFPVPDQLFQNSQQLQFIPDIQIAGRLIQYNDLRLLAQGSGKQDSLPLAITDGGKGPFGDFPGVDPIQRGLNHFLVPFPQQSQGTGVGVAARGHHIPAGHELRMDALGHNNGHFLGDLPAGKPVHGSILHQHRTGYFAKLPHNGF